jgi:hypothetical protein
LSAPITAIGPRSGGTYKHGILTWSAVTAL